MKAAQGAFRRYRPPFSYVADFDDAAQMIDTAVALRTEGFEVRCGVSTRRLYVTAPKTAVLPPAFPSDTK
jgi:hypothetical protein